jgi:uncharacterized protein YtpQ (UPF0354 family)
MGNDEHPRLTTFRHLGDAFSIDYPAHWEHVVSENSLSVVFQSTSQTGVALLIMILPYSVDIELFEGEPEDWLGKFLKQAGAEDVCVSKLLCYPAVFGVTSDGAKSWVTAHDDVIMAISIHYPDSHEHIYQPLTDRMLSSFRISRQKQVERQRLLLKIVRQLRAACPNAGFVVKGDKVANEQLEFGVDNLEATIARNPQIAEEAIAHVVGSIVDLVRAQESLGKETWAEIQGNVFPMIRPDSIVNSLADRTVENESKEEQEQRTIVAAPWLADLVVCYAIDQEKTLRMISAADMLRWNIDAATLHQKAMDNLRNSELPEFAGVATPEGELVFGGLGQGGLSSKSSYVLHPGLYQMVRAKLGAHAWVAIPSRDSLMFFAQSFTSRALLQRTVAGDYQSSDHRLSDRLFELTPDGLVLA